MRASPTLAPYPRGVAQLGQACDAVAGRNSARVPGRFALGAERIWLTGLCIAGSAALLWMAQPPIGLGWLAPVALVPWLLAVWVSSARAGARSGLLVGTTYGVLSAAWIAGGLERMGASLLHAWLGALAVAVWGAGLPWAVLGAAFAVTRRSRPELRVAAVALALLVVDSARSHLPGGLPWALLGHSQWEIPGAAQLAVVGGVPLISAFLGAFNAAAAALVGAWQRRLERARALCLAGSLAAAYGALLLWGVPIVEWSRRAEPLIDSSRLELLAVQPDIPASERWVPELQRTHLAIVSRQTVAAWAESERAPDLVVWPETLLTTPIDVNGEVRRALHQTVEQLAVPVILGVARSSREGDASRYRNSAVWVAPDAGVIAGFDKTRAIPVVESASGFPGRALLEWLMGLPASRPLVEEGAAREPLRGRKAFGVTLCFEAIFPGLVEARRTPDTVALLNLANDSWYVDATPSVQQVAFASFRAIEQRLWLVRVAHGGVSAVVDPFGRVVSQVPFGTKGVLRASVAREPAPTGLERTALAALLLGAGVLGYGLAFACTRRWQS